MMLQLIQPCPLHFFLQVLKSWASIRQLAESYPTTFALPPHGLISGLPSNINLVHCCIAAQGFGLIAASALGNTPEDLLALAVARMYLYANTHLCIALQVPKVLTCVTPDY